jgi:hypothetical protein
MGEVGGERVQAMGKGGRLEVRGSKLEAIGKDEVEREGSWRREVGEWSRRRRLKLRLRLSTSRQFKKAVQQGRS